MNFIKVKKDKNIYYGGAQEWFSKKRNQSMGCGIIAAANVIKTINGYENNSFSVDYESFMNIANELSKKYIYVLPKFGINGIFLSIGINRYFRKYKMNYRSHWGTSRYNIWNEISRMLNENIPVVLAIGPSNLRFINKKRLPLYVRQGNVYVCNTYTSAHYVSVTEINDDYITISSWGKKYYVYKNDFMMYAKKQSNFLFSNILVIRRR